MGVGFWVGTIRCRFGIGGGFYLDTSGTLLADGFRRVTVVGTLTGRIRLDKI